MSKVRTSRGLKNKFVSFLGCDCMMNRNMGLECYRCLLMLGIVMIHASGHCHYQQRWGTVFFDWCVAGFVFISGYFGIKFRPSKIISLVGIGLFCSFSSGALSGAGWKSMLIGSNGFWFLWAYIVLMMLAPLIDAALERRRLSELIRILSPIGILVGVWMFLLCVPVVREYLPKPRGLEGLTFISLVPSYIAARLYRMFELHRYISKCFVLIATPICLFMFVCGFWWYWWVPALLVAVITFRSFSDLKIPNFLGRVAVFLAPSMFSVYMLHFSGGGVRIMTDLQIELVDECRLPLLWANVIVALVAYFGSVGVDMIRRCFVYLAHRQLQMVCSFVDELYEKTIRRVTKI